MSKYKYEVICRVLRRGMPDADSNAYRAERMMWVDIVLDMCRSLRSEDNAFVPAMFLEECGYYEGEG